MNDKDIDAIDVNGHYPLETAIRDHNRKLVTVLLGKGARVTRTVNGSTCLHLAIECNSSDDIALLLLQHGANVDASDYCARTPLFIACAQGKFAMASTLLRLGATIHHDCFLMVQGLLVPFRTRPLTHRVLIHWQIVGIVLALAPLDLPGYILLWITDWLPNFMAENCWRRVQLMKELAKITLITNTITSIRRALGRRKKFEKNDCGH